MTREQGRSIRVGKERFFHHVGHGQVGRRRSTGFEAAPDMIDGNFWRAKRIGVMLGEVHGNVKV